MSFPFPCWPQARRLAIATLSSVMVACGGGDGEIEAPPAAVNVTVGGQLSGLGAGKTLVLGHYDPNGQLAQSASLTANGAYGLSVPAGTAYDIRIVSQPAGQACQVTNAKGVASESVANVAVGCADAGFKLGGVVQGLAPAQTLVLARQPSGAEPAAEQLPLQANGPFQFAALVQGTYNVVVAAQPAGQVCTVTNGSGQATADVGSIQVSCVAAGWKLGGVASGLPAGGSATLLNTVSGQTLGVTSNGGFTFAALLANGSAYNVALLGTSSGVDCAIASGSGTATADVTSIQLSCSPAVVLPPAPPPPVVAMPPAAPTGLTVSYSIKGFNFNWGTVTDATSYQLLEDADGGAGPLVYTPLASGLAGTAYTQTLAIHRRLNATYSVQACNAAGCGAASAAIAPNLAQAIGYVKASNTQASDFFGFAMAISGDGNTLAVSARGESSNATGVNGTQADNSAIDSGAVYVFQRAASGAWAQQAYLKASNTAGNDLFGQSLALSSDGNTLAVGANLEDSNATGVNGDQTDNTAFDSGAVYVFTRAAGTWSQQAYVKASNPDPVDWFGWSVALSGDGNTLAVSAVFEASTATGINGNQANNGASNAGAVYVFARAGGVWTQQAYVKASNTQADDRFGESVALSADGDTLAVGATGEASNATGINGNQADNGMAAAGAVYVFSRSAGVWSQQAYVKASNTGAADHFGWSVALAGDGNTLAVGANREDGGTTGINGNGASNALLDSGAAYVFTRAGGAWSQQAYIKASNTGSLDLFGHRVTLSGDGNLLAVGANVEASSAAGINGSQADNSTNLAGAVYVFERSAGIWSQRSYVKAPNPGMNYSFGWSLGLSADGGTLAVGSSGERSNATGVGGDQTNTGTVGAGAAYLY